MMILAQNRASSTISTAENTGKLLNVAHARHKNELICQDVQGYGRLLLLTRHGRSYDHRYHRNIFMNSINLDDPRPLSDPGLTCAEYFTTRLIGAPEVATTL